MADNTKEIEAAIKTLQLASMGQPKAIQAVREHYAEFSKILPAIQQHTAAAFKPAASSQLSDADVMKVGIPIDQVAQARQAQGPAPQDAMAKRYEEVLSLLAPRVDMEAETITAPSTPKPTKSVKPKLVRTGTYTPLSIAPENDQQQLGAALLSLMGGAGMPGSEGLDQPLQLREPQLTLPKPRKAL